MVSWTIMPKASLFWIHDTDLRQISHPFRTDLCVWKQFWRYNVLDSNNFMHSCPHPVLKGSRWNRERPSPSLPPCHSCQCGQVSEFQSWVFVRTLRLSESMFSPHWNPFHCLLNILIFSHAHTHHTLHGVSACRPSFSLFRYWSLCPHSWCQSCFLQVHFKGIQPPVFRSQENNTESLLCTCSIDSLSWLNFTASQKL